MPEEGGCYDNATPLGLILSNVLNTDHTKTVRAQSLGAIGAFNCFGKFRNAKVEVFQDKNTLPLSKRFK